jgi:beta-xylosidase
VFGSPFARFVVTDYYDGLRAGFAECGVCKTAYKVNLVDWDSNQNLRILRFQQVETSPFRVIDEFGDSFDAKWPFLILFDKPANRELIDRFERIPVTMSRKALMIASENVSELLLAVQELESEDAGDKVDWFANWSLPREDLPM